MRRAYGIELAASAVALIVSDSMAHAVEPVRLIGLPGTAFTTTGAQADRNSALIAAGISAKFSERVSFGLNLDGELSANSRRLGRSAQVRVSF